MILTVREVIDNVAKNGYPWTQGEFYNQVTGASCALGQAARNLGFDPHKRYKIEGNDGPKLFDIVCWKINDVMFHAIYDMYPESPQSDYSIITINDTSSSTTKYKEIVEQIRKVYPPEVLDIEFELKVEEWIV